MQSEKGITRSNPPTGNRGSAQGGEVTTYSLRDMSIESRKAHGLTKYVRKENEEEIE